MIILGDVAYPFDEINLNKKFNDLILLNCEGYLINNKNNNDGGVFNNSNFLKNLSKQEIILGLANNYIMDSNNGVTQSIKIANEKNFHTVGAGLTLENACTPLIINNEENKIAIIAAGWDVIGCKVAKQKKQGVAPFFENSILENIKTQKKQNRKVLIFLHWGYELEIYPHPSHRESAKRFIDAGADLIVGCHSHCLQGYETYNNKKIFYGLGNAIFKENFYYNGKLSFPEICKSGLVLNWNPNTNDIQVASITLEQEKNQVNISDFIPPSENIDLINLSKFSNLSFDEYKVFFQKKQKKKESFTNI